MARRYGGRHSPGATEVDAAPVELRRTRAGGRVNFLFIVPFVFAIRAFWSEPAGLALALVAFGVLMLAAWMTREGVLAQEAYDARTVARRPAIPRKIFGSVLTGLGLGLGVYGFDGSLAAPLLFVILGGALHLIAFGPDPLKNKGIEGVDQFQSDRVARAVTEAERHLSEMHAAIARVGDRDLEARVTRFQRHVRQLFRTVENDPRRLSAARRYLGVYLLGARDATVKFAELQARRRDPEARAGYLTLLEDLERNFAARTQTLMSGDREALDIEIEVLRERLQREGVRPE